MTRAGPSPAAGRFLPIAALERLLSVLRLRRTAARAAPLSGEERLAMIFLGFRL